MNSKSKFLVYLIALFWFISGAQQAFCQASQEQPVAVSLIQLIANPDVYHGKRVRLIGFCHFEFEGNALYLHKEDFDNHILQNAVWLDADMNKFGKTNNMYVVVEAVFDGNAKGHKGLFSGMLRDVRRLQPWK